VRDAVRIPLYGCDCYAYGLLAAGHCDLVCEADLKPYDYMALVPIIQVGRARAHMSMAWRGVPRCLAAPAGADRETLCRVPGARSSLPVLPTRAAARVHTHTHTHTHTPRQGAGGVITDWRGRPLAWSDVGSGVASAPGEVLAAGDPATHAQALALLDWQQ
jgi:hypothetical protein